VRFLLFAKGDDLFSSYSTDGPDDGLVAARAGSLAESLSIDGVTGTSGTSVKVVLPARESMTSGGKLRFSVDENKRVSGASSSSVGWLLRPRQGKDSWMGVGILLTA